MHAFPLSVLAALAAGDGALTQASGDGGLTLGEILANVPHDASAFVVYALILGSVVFVWRAGRSRPSGTPGD